MVRRIIFSLQIAFIVLILAQCSMGQTLDSKTREILTAIAQNYIGTNEIPIHIKSWYVTWEVLFPESVNVYIHQQTLEVIGYSKIDELFID